MGVHALDDDILEDPEDEAHAQNAASEKSDEAFIGGLKTLVRTLCDTSMADLDIGPQYRIEVNGESYSVTTVFGTKRNNDDGQKIRQIFYILMHTAYGKIVGYRQGILEFFDGLILASSGIHIGPKGKGLAVPLELIHGDLLQRVADAHGQEVIWPVENKNLLQYWKLEQAHRSGELSAAQLQHKHTEQQRWQSIYGTGGKLGVTMDDEINGKKSFYPQGTPDVSLDCIEEIHLERTLCPENATVTAQVRSLTCNSDNQSLADKKIRRLKVLLLPYFLQV